MCVAKPRVGFRYRHTVRTLHWLPFAQHKVKFGKDHCTVLYTHHVVGFQHNSESLNEYSAASLEYVAVPFG